jgi:hypothetical protein
MASGDVVNAISGDNTELNFQPAANVECVIKSCFMNGVGGYVKITDGANETYLNNGATIYQGGNGVTNLNMLITNTNYLKIDALGVSKRGAYTGIQIK